MRPFREPPFQMSTPEGKVKERVKKLLAQYKPHLYAHWPVQNGMGSPTLDCTGAINGRSFAIETKAPGKELTPRQALTVAEMAAAGVVVWVIDGDPALMRALDQWLAYWGTRAAIENGMPC